MTAECKSDRPCGQHITITLWILGLLVTILSGSVYGTIDNRNKAVDEHRLMIHAMSEEDNLLRAEANTKYAEIIQRLSRIEQKISR